jgi:cholesterol oxidase
MDVLSRPLGELWDHDRTVVVVGSGYGGAIAANRLARAGLEPVVLERGRELHPGDFPATDAEAARRVQLSAGDAPTLDRRNLFWFHLSDHMNVLTGCGLGGTSLINANVSIRPSDSIFEHHRWPKALRGKPRKLDGDYQRAWDMLQPTPYPESYPPLRKMAALRQAGGKAPFDVPALNVRFQSGPNAVGELQHACTCCGDCVTGCNVGAKNTLLMNYLPDAVHRGALVFTEVDVEWIAPRAGGGWSLHVTSLGDETAPDGRGSGEITARMVVLAAGSLGSTGILLRSRQRGLAVSDRLGSCFSANGDVLGFATHTSVPVSGIGEGAAKRKPEDLPGPCITALIDRRSDAVSQIIEDAAIPGALEPLVPDALELQSLATTWDRLLHGRGPGRPGFIRSRLRRGKRGALRHTQTYLAMGVDGADGTIVIDRRGDPTVVWGDVTSSGYYRKADPELRRAAHRVGGRFVPNPMWRRVLKDHLITVHPLGGCAMADRAEDGVVDHRGRVFDGPSGTSHHDGLFVWDGSIVPTALGVNPLLTISALTERAVRLEAARQKWTIDGEMPDPPPVVERPTLPPDTPVLSLEDRLEGTWAPARGRPGEVPEDFEAALDAATKKKAPRALSFDLSVTADDVRTVIHAPDTPMAVSGAVTAEGLASDSPPPGALEVRGGTLQLVFPLPGADEDSHMVYELPLVAPGGERFHLSGFKLLHPGTTGELWPDTSTLYLNIHRGGPDGALVGMGIMRVRVGDFANLLRTIRVSGSVGHFERLEWEARFGLMFAGKMFHDYGHVVHPANPMRRGAPPRRRRPLDVPEPEVVAFAADVDGVTLRLTRYDGSTWSGRRRNGGATVALSHGMGANPLSFSFDTVRPNLLEVLVAEGYDVWLQEWRGSTLLASAQTASFTGDDVAARDHPATERTIREHTGSDEIHWVTHCVGTLTFLMSMLRGDVHPSSLVCSQMGLYPVATTFMRAKVGLHLGELLRRAGIKHLTSDSYDDESVANKLFDQFVRLNYVPRDQRCDQAVCHRLAFLYGVAVDHAAIDEVTHLALHELFGVTNLDMMSHLSACARAERLVDATGDNDYLPGNEDRLQLPITLLHGAKNGVWVPETTSRTLADLVGWFGPARYHREVFEHHGHQDSLMGASAWRDVYPAVLAHLRRWA